jgi:hypothetical protein
MGVCSKPLSDKIRILRKINIPRQDVTTNLIYLPNASPIMTAGKFVMPMVQEFCGNAKRLAIYHF